MQINRLFEIIYILLDTKIITAKELADKFEVSSRTIYRDIEILSSAGIPVYMTKGKNGGISILSEFIFNKAILTKEEKSEILSSIKAVNAISFNNKELDAILKKLNNVLGKDFADWIEVDFSNWGNSKTEKFIFDKLKFSILNKKIIKFSYSNQKGESSTRKVYPIKLYFKGQSWYLYGFCKYKNDYRFFKLRRIKNIYVYDEIFDTKNFKTEIEKKPFSNNDFVDLKLKISSKLSYRVYDEFENFKKLEDGSFIVSVKYPKGDWLFNYIFSFGENCEILSPIEIKKTLKNKIQKMLLNYS